MPDITPNEAGAKIVHDAKNTAQEILATAERVASGIVKTANSEPTNADLKELFDKHAKDDFEFQQMQIETNSSAEQSRISIHKRLNDLPSHDETAKIVEDVIKKLIFKQGKFVYTGIIGASILIGALVVIFGGFKTVLAWLGFVAITK